MRCLNCGRPTADNEGYCCDDCWIADVNRKGPEDNDYVTEDYITFHLHSEPWHEITVTGNQPWYEELLELLEEESYSPNVWYEDSEGNYHLLELATGGLVEDAPNE